MGGERKWLAVAMILSLLLSMVIFIDAIRIVGVTALGGWALGVETGATYGTNATMWNVYSSFGAVWYYLLIVGVGIMLVVGICYSIKRTPLREM